MAVTQCSSALIYGAEDCAEHSFDGLLVLSSHLIIGVFEGASLEEQLFLAVLGFFMIQMSCEGTGLMSYNLPSSFL